MELFANANNSRIKARKDGRIVRNVVTNVAHIPWPISFHYSHLFQWSSGSSFPRFAITVFDRSSGQSNKCSTLLSSGPRMPPPFVTGFVHHRCVKISRHARQALPCLPSPFPFHLIFRHFRTNTNTKNRAELSRSRIRLFQSLGGGKLKWSKIEDRWRIFDILVYFYNFRYFSNILLLLERRNWSIQLVYFNFNFNNSRYLQLNNQVRRLKWYIYIFGRISGGIFSMGSILMYLLFHNH